VPRTFEARPNNPALGQLVRLHADMGGKIHENKKEAGRLATDMMHVEAVIRMFDPAYDVRRIAVKRKRTRNPWFKRGALFREAIGVMRTAEGPLSTREIGIRLLAAQGIPEPTLEQVRHMAAALRASLENHKSKDIQRVGEGMPKRWALV
jgi:hypothetical protein